MYYRRASTSDRHDHDLQAGGDQGPQPGHQEQCQTRRTYCIRTEMDKCGYILILNSGERERWGRDKVRDRQRETKTTRETEREKNRGRETERKTENETRADLHILYYRSTVCSCAGVAQDPGQPWTEKERDDRDREIEIERKRDLYIFIYGHSFFYYRCTGMLMCCWWIRIPGLSSPLTSTQTDPNTNRNTTNSTCFNFGRCTCYTGWHLNTC